MLNLFSLVSIASAETDCSTRIPNAMFAKKLDAIENSLQNRDLPQMTQKMEQTTESIPCLAQPITPMLASKYHMLSGIYYFINKEQNLAEVYFISARTAVPESSIPTKFFPEGHILHSLYNDASPMSDTDPITPPLKGDLTFDGISQSARPLFRPTIFQHVAGGKAQFSVLISNDDQPLPEYATEDNQASSENKPSAESTVPTPKEAAEAAVAKETMTTTPAVSTEKSFPIYLASGGTLLASGAVLLFANKHTQNFIKLKSYTSDFSSEDSSELFNMCNEYSVDLEANGTLEMCNKEINSKATTMGVASGGLMLLGTAGLAVHFVF